ncbi:MAG: sulfotransferase [Bacteroidota bacterium]
MENKRPVLVTGSIRSGTTWVGRMLALAPGTSYYEEPFNLLNGSLYGLSLPQDFIHVHPGNEERFISPIKSAIGLSFSRSDLSRRLQLSKTIRHKAVTLKEFLNWHLRFGAAKRPIVKDPIALASAEWLNTRFHALPVIMIRHPAAYISSLNRLGWGLDFNWFLQQPKLMENRLEPFRQQMLDIQKPGNDRIDHGILSWNLVHYLIADYREKHPDWLFVRHEDLSREPLSGFRDMFKHLGLEFTTAVQREIENHTAAENPTDAPEGVIHSLRRDSAGNIFSWKKKLTVAEISRIRKGTRAVASRFYSDTDW